MMQEEPKIDRIAEVEVRATCPLTCALLNNSFPAFIMVSYLTGAALFRQFN